MIQRVAGNNKASIFAFDFNCRSDDKTIEKNVASIWIASIKGDGEETVVEDIAAFVDRIVELSVKSSICLYCFDLGFHWSFIFYELLRRGFQFSKSINQKSKDRFTAFSNPRTGVTYSAAIKPTKGGIIFFKDFKAIYTGFKTVPDMAAAFHYEGKFFPEDFAKVHKPGKLTDEEKVTSLSKVSFIFDVLKAHEKDPQFFRSFTLASYSVKSAIRKSCGWAGGSQYAVYRSEKLYPKITNPGEVEALRLSVKGGLTGPTISAIDQGLYIDKPIFVVDRTQAYPSIMAFQKLPRGTGEYFAGFRPMSPGSINLYHVIIKSFDNVKMHSLPGLMQTHKHFLTRSDESVDLWIWEPEFYILPSFYENVEAEVIEGFSYRCGISPFKQYIIENQEKRKEAEEKGDRISAGHYKFLNVSLYGKLIQKNSKQTTEEYLDDDGLLTVKVKDREEEKEAAYVYLPAGSAIPAFARVNNLLLALRFGLENVLYIETDALIVEDNEKTRSVLNSMDLSHDLGHYHLEAHGKRAYFPMAKRYKYEKDDGETVVKGAGLSLQPIAAGKGFDEIKIDDTVVEMRQKHRAPGGIIMAKINKKLKKTEVEK